MIRGSALVIGTRTGLDTTTSRINMAQPHGCSRSRGYYSSFEHRTVALHQSRVVSSTKQTNKTNCPSRLYIRLVRLKVELFFSLKPHYLPPPHHHHHIITTPPNHLTTTTTTITIPTTSSSSLLPSPPISKYSHLEVDVTVLSLRVNNPLH